MKSLNKVIIIAFIVLISAVVAKAQGPNKAYEDNMKVVDSVMVGATMQPVFAIYSGDINQDGFIDILDIPMLTSGIEDPNPYGYLDTDLNGDGFVDILDIPILTTNAANSITLLRPY